MQSIGIAELQKNVGILTQMKEPLIVVDKRKNREIAVIYPREEKREPSGRIRELSKRLRAQAKERKFAIEDLARAKEEAMLEAMREKYGLPD